MDHDIDVYERQDGEQLVYLKVMKFFMFFLKKKQSSHFTFREFYLQYTWT